MAGFVTANRWATGIETHKTSEGRILCTGVGCAGCFPDIFSSEASELGVCDVDLTGGILGLRPFLDEENSRENLKLNSKNFLRRQKRVKPRAKRQKGKIDQGRMPFERDVKALETDKEKSASEKPPRISSVATQTELSEIGIDTQPVVLEVLNNGYKHDLLTFEEEESKTDKEGIDGANQRQSSVNSSTVEVDDNINKTHRNAQRLFDQPSSGSRFEKIHDKMYIVSKKEIALSLCDDSICEDDFFEHASRDRASVNSTKQHRSSRGEDAVCFFFALEYYNSQRILPQFRVMEIVEALSTFVDLKDVKCVQRISGRWQIVLKSRKYNKLLRKCGVKLRGRVYQLVDDVDGYFDVIR